MAISVVQTSAKQVTDNATTQTYSFTPTTGNAIVVPVIVWRAAGPSRLLSVSDNVDGVYTRDAYYPDNNTGAAVFLFRLPKCTGTTRTITVNGVSSATFFVTCAIEVGVEGNALLLDVLSMSAGSSTTPTTGATRTTTIASALLIAVMEIQATQASITVESTSPTWTQAIEELSFAAHIPGEVDYKVVSSAAAYTGNWTCASTGNWAAIIASYVESGGTSSGGEHSAVF